MKILLLTMFTFLSVVPLAFAKVQDPEYAGPVTVTTYVQRGSSNTNIQWSIYAPTSGVLPAGQILGGGGGTPPSTPPPPNAPVCNYAAGETLFTSAIYKTTKCYDYKTWMRFGVGGWYWYTGTRTTFQKMSCKDKYGNFSSSKDLLVFNRNEVVWDERSGPLPAGIPMCP